MNKISTYHEAKEYLESLIPKPDGKHQGQLRLERISSLLELMGEPQNKFKTVHVGGTSGKGSTALILGSILKVAGYKTGLYRSPHLQLITERIQINNHFMPIGIFLKNLNEIIPLVSQVEDEVGLGAPTYFEVLVALAYQYFAQEKVDLAVIEVGVGGRGDATNVICPEVAIITNVGLDHTNILGKTLREIAQEKKEIIKAGSSVVSGVTQKSPVEIIKQKCRQEKVDLSLASQDFQIRLKKIDGQGEIFDLQTPNFFYKDLKLSLLGEFQIKNAALAIVAIEKLQKRGFKVAEKHIRQALAKISFPGRMEVVGRNPLVILDGAHNPAKIKALTSSLPKIFKYQRLIFITGFKKGKDIKKMCQILSRIGSKFVITQAKLVNSVGAKISQDPQSISGFFKKKNFILEPDSCQAVKKTLLCARKGDLVCVTGSLYLVGEVRELWFPSRFN